MNWLLNNPPKKKRNCHWLLCYTYSRDTTRRFGQTLRGRDGNSNETMAFVCCETMISRISLHRSRFFITLKRTDFVGFPTFCRFEWKFKTKNDCWTGRWSAVQTSNVDWPTRRCYYSQSVCCERPVGFLPFFRHGPGEEHWNSNVSVRPSYACVCERYTRKRE
jgi:hypothetical protein